MTEASRDLGRRPLPIGKFKEAITTEMVALRALKQKAKFYGLDDEPLDEVELEDGLNLLEDCRQRR